MKVNHEIRSPKVRLISELGEQVGVVSIQEALQMAHDAGLDLVEVVATSTPPVCKIIDHGKFRYDQTKKEKESRKSQHQIKVKEVKLSANISEHDLDFKRRHAREFLEGGNKVKFTLVFRGREVMHPEKGEKIMQQMLADVDDLAMVETQPKLMGKTLSVVVAPAAKKKKVATTGTAAPVVAPA